MSAPTDPPLNPPPPTAPPPAAHPPSPDAAAADAALFRIGTRRSALARVQTAQVERALRRAWPGARFEVRAMDPLGDRDKETPLPSLGAGAKSLWTHELEALLEAGEVDFVVHSLKDMPTQLPARCAIGAILPREDARDALVVAPALLPACASLAALPAGSTIGTSSLRRSAQLRRRHPHLRFADVRGNVGTRLAKLDAPGSPFAALVLAAAGLKRLGLGARVTAYLSRADGGVLHAVGQGALGVEVREGDARVDGLLAPVRCARSTWACLAERSLMRTLEGGCSVPIGVETEWARRPRAADGRGGAAAEDGGEGEEKEEEGEGEEGEMTGELVMRAIVVSLDGTEAVEAEHRRAVASAEDADEFGWEIARVLIERGAARILQAINLHRNIVQAQGNA